MNTHVLRRDTGLPRQEFPCNQCGLCCQHVDLSAETRFLDRGDGVCRHYDAAARTCTIYAQRPDICRVELHYDTYYADRCTWDEFVALNLQACAALAAMDGAGHVTER